MANLGNAWHIPGSPEPIGVDGMRVPVGATIPITTMTIYSGNQFQGNGNAGDQQQVGSFVAFKRSTDAGWTNLPMIFDTVNGNNKYYRASIPIVTLQPGDIVQYYLCIAYGDHDTTFLSANGAVSATVSEEATAQASPFTVTMAAASVAGQWSRTINLSNVPIHTHVLPTGKVLYWGRRETPGDLDFASLNEHETHAFLFDPATGTDTPTAQEPKDSKGNTINLFCSSHTLLADGRLMVVGGHLFDSCGIAQSTIYDPIADTWSAAPEMNNGRWYPSAVTLADGGVLVCSGTYATFTAEPPNLNPAISQNETPQKWVDGSPWVSLVDFTVTKDTLPLFPRLHLAPDGRVFMSGALAPSFFLDTSGHGTWSQGPTRAAGFCEYAPSVMYDAGKVLYIGGGGGQGIPPTNAAETIDLNTPPAQWLGVGNGVSPMNFRRRQHNATLLPDGSVLVTGGTQGGGGPTNGFNDLTPGNPVHVAELWNPNSKTWTLLAEESVDRCYHSTAVLLPDGTVLSAGGGEYQPVAGVFQSNDPSESHADGQIFSPPYLFNGERPKINSCQDTIQYGETFDIGTDNPGDIAKISLVRLSSVTHSFDQNQRINFLVPTTKASVVTVTAPPSPDLCPPGHYMLFLLNNSLVPSVAHIVKIAANPVAAVVANQAVRRPALAPLPVISPTEKDSIIISRAKSAGRSPVVVGINATCIYGLATCYAGARGALGRLPGVEDILHNADARYSVAYLFLDNDGLPDISRWRDEFSRATNGSYGWRGVEMTLQGAVQNDGTGNLVLAANASRPAVALRPLQLEERVQLDLENGVPVPLSQRERTAYDNLARCVAAQGPQYVRVIGPLREVGDGFQLAVRLTKPLVRAIFHANLSEIGRDANVPVAVARQPKGLAPGFKSNPANDLKFDGGHTIRDLTYGNFFVGEWADADVVSIDHALAAVMTDRGMNGILEQYFDGNSITTTVLPSQRIGLFGGATVNKTDVESLVTRLHGAGTLGAVDFTSTVFNFMLPKGVFLTTNDASNQAEAHADNDDAQASDGLVRPQEDDADDSTAGLGGYHGSVEIAVGGGATLVYYAIGVFSEQTAGVTNGIPVFDLPWKNVVATFYHELTEARTDPDVEVGNSTGNASNFGWVASNGEIGDIPIDLASNINMVIKEIRLSNGELSPVQLMYSNRVHGPEQPPPAA